ncbi:MAG: substrate-binding domain-containing protein [Gammaproteobacteria bacterium]|nr:substrate-binding domain-containing protein [Gammaproteobacteria bacterium]
MRYLSALLGALLLSTLSPTSFAETRFTVAFPQDNLSNDWRAAQVAEVKSVLDRHPEITFVVSDAAGNAGKQALDLMQLADSGLDAVITSPRDARVMTPVIDEIYSSGVPVILLTRRTLNHHYTTFIGADDHAIGLAAAHEIAHHLHGRGRVVMLQGVATASTSRARGAGFRQGLSHYPGLLLVAHPVANYLRHEALQAMERLLSADVTFDALFAQSDSMASGARLAMKKAGVNPASKVIVGIDYIQEARDAIRSGEQTASFTYPTAGREGAEILLRVLAGERVEKEVSVPFVKVTRSNVEQVAPIFE